MNIDGYHYVTIAFAWFVCTLILVPMLGFNFFPIASLVGVPVSVIACYQNRESIRSFPLALLSLVMNTIFGGTYVVMFVISVYFWTNFEGPG